MQSMQTSRRQFLGGLCALPFVANAAPGRAPLLLALDAPHGIDPVGYLVSEKYDGVRAWWEGQTLRFRSGLPIAAPAWFVAQLPPLPLDGELWLGRGRFEALSAAVRRHRPADDEWRQIRYMLFELPGAAGSFADRAERMRALVLQLQQNQRSPALMAIAQATLPDRAALQRQLRSVVAGGGEGLMLHRADAPSISGRSPVLYKLKPVFDAEATVLGHLGGRGKHAGRLGALQVRNADGVAFAIGTGFSDAERENPPPRGTLITYTYRGHTEAGVPRFASFLRRRED